jgi:plastocyanin
VRATAVAVALGLATLVAGPGVAQAAPPAGATVSDVVVGFTFVVGYAALNAPDQAVRLHPGDTVEWTNLDPVAHSISLEALPTVLYLKKPGDKASMTFTNPGYYMYRCVEHPQAPGMQGVVFISD